MLRTIRRLLIGSALLMAALAPGPSLSALDPAKRISQYIHNSWTTNDGLPQDSINAIAQTPDGYLWVATQEGLARFDGVNFRTFDSRNTEIFDADFIHALFVDRAGTLWIGVGDGMLRYDGKDSFTKFGDAHGFHGSAAKYFSEDAFGNLWIGVGTGRPTKGKGLYRFTNGRAQQFTTADGLPSDQVYQTWTDGSGALWVATHAGLAVLRNGRFSTYTTADGLPDNWIRAVREDHQGNLWVGTHNGLARFDGSRFTSITTKDGLRDNDIESLYEDRDAVLWVSTSKGLNRIVNGTIETAPMESLRDDRIHTVLEDRERNLWIGSHSSGLHRLRSGKFTPYGPPEGMVGQSVHGIYQDRAGRIWIGTAPGGVNVLHNNTITTFSAAEGFPSLQPKGFLEDRAGVLWIATEDGLVRYAEGRFRLFGVEDGLPHHNILVAYEDRAGTLWVSTDGGVARRNGDRFERIAVDMPTLQDVRIIHEDARGRILFAGGDDLGYFEGGRFVQFLPELLRGPNFISHHVDADGTLWLTTWGDGLIRVRDGRAVKFTSADGLFDDTIWSIVDDGHGSFWMGSNRGIFRVSRNELENFADRKIARITSVVFDTADGLRRRETNVGKPAAIRARDGRLWFATTGGAVVIDPADMEINRVAPTVVIERLLIDEQEVPLGDTLIMRAGARSLEIDYAALSLVSPSKVRYRYKLDGFDDHWIEAGARRSAHYTNIDPGEYTFHVTAANEDGIFATEGARLPLRIERFFYQTWWFYLIAAASVLLLAFLVRLARKRAIEIRHRVYHDQLTGLPNRVLLTERAEVALRQAERRGRSIAILFLDLDGFKGVNDRYGHATGDHLLKLVADRLRACIREFDTLARIGGDEFAALVADLEDEARAAEVAQRMIDAIRGGFLLNETAIPLGVSIGIAFHPYDGHDIPSILQAADRAMYRAKLAGGNRYEYNIADRDELTVF